MSYELPELPEGYFWRIYELSLYKYPMIQIRKKHWIGSTEVCETRIDKMQSQSWEEATVFNAEWLKDRKFLPTTEQDTFMDKAWGDYPPKTTEDWK